MNGTKKLFGWRGPVEARQAWDRIGHRFEPFRIVGRRGEIKRKTAWDAWALAGWDINKSVLVRQDTGDCVSFGAAIATMSVLIEEIIVNKEFGKIRVPFPPYLYGISRVMPEGGNGRLRGDAGSLGSWMADTIVKYGVLPEDHPGVPKYSGKLADKWGDAKSPWEKFVDFADDHRIRKAARLTTVDDLAEAVSNGYYATIASNKGYAMQLKDEKGKSWYVGSDVWPHQMSILAVDVEPELCFYRRNQWGENAHGDQLDGPRGGGWVKAKELAKELRNSGTECFAYSQFEDFYAEEDKPWGYLG